MNLPDLAKNTDSRSDHRITINLKICDCNGHSTTCNGITGACTNCLDNTSGNKCEICHDGFYGDPKDKGQCLPCECPNARYK